MLSNISISVTKKVNYEQLQHTSKMVTASKPMALVIILFVFIHQKQYKKLKCFGSPYVENLKCNTLQKWLSWIVSDQLTFYLFKKHISMFK